MMPGFDTRKLIIHPTTKGFLVDRPTSVAELLVQQPAIFDGPFAWPLMVLDRDAMQHNIDLHAEFCRARGIELSPHGKTTMAPAIFAAQFAAGAWAMTAATINQVRAYRSFGIDRVILANELWLGVASNGCSANWSALTSSSSGAKWIPWQESPFSRRRCRQCPANLYSMF